LKRFSATLDQSALLMDKPWVVSNPTKSFEKLIFRSDGRVHFSKDGQVTDGKWEYLPEAQSLLIDYGNRKILYRHQYLDEAVLALKIDGRLDSEENYFLLVNEKSVPDCDAKSYLRRKYLQTNNIEVKLLSDGTELEITKNQNNSNLNNIVHIDGKPAIDGVYLVNNKSQKLYIKNGQLHSVKNLIHYPGGFSIWQDPENTYPIVGDEVHGNYKEKESIDVYGQSLIVSIDQGIVTNVKNKTDRIVIMMLIIFFVILIISFIIM